MDEKRFEEVTPEDERELGTPEGRTKDETITDREKVESIFENNPENSHWWFRPATVAGIISGIAGAIGNILHVFISNILFGKREQLEIRAAFQRAQRDYSAKADRKKESKENKEQKDERGKQQKDERSNEQENKQKEQKEKEAENQTSHPAKEEEKLDISAETRDYAAEAMMGSPDIQSVFRQLGFAAEPVMHGDEIYLLKKTEEGLTKSVYGMSKMDLLKGDAKSLASAIYAYGSGTKTECAMKAAVTIAASRYLANQEEFKEGQLTGSSMRLSYVGIKTQDGADYLSITGSARGVDAVDLRLNGEVIASLPLEQLVNTPYTAYSEKLMESVSEPNQEFGIGTRDKDRVEVEKAKDGFQVTVLRGEERKALGVYSFQKESDVRKLMQCFKEQDVRVNVQAEKGLQRINPASLAYTIAVLSNPDMQPERNVSEEVLNTYTGKPEADGKPHIYPVHTERGVQLKLFLPDVTGNSYDTLLVNSWQSRNLLTEKDIESLALSIRDANQIVKENRFHVCEGYHREDVLEKGKDDYFNVPIIGVPEVAKEMTRQEYFRDMMNFTSLEVIEEADREAENLFRTAAAPEQPPEQDGFPADRVFTEDQIQPGTNGGEEVYVVGYDPSELEEIGEQMAADEEER